MLQREQGCFGVAAWIPRRWRAAVAAVTSPDTHTGTLTLVLPPTSAGGERPLQLGGHPRPAANPALCPFTCPQVESTSRSSEDILRGMLNGRVDTVEFSGGREGGNGVGWWVSGQAGERGIGPWRHQAQIPACGSRRRGLNPAGPPRHRVCTVGGPTLPPAYPACPPLGAGGNVYVDAPRPGRIYLPGSFNPLHDGHKEMLEVSSRGEGGDLAI